MISVSTEDFKSWAQTSVAQNVLGEFTLRLVHSSIPLSSIKHERFLSYGANFLSSWDGLLEIVASNDSRIPIGNSVWEVSGQDGAKNKIETDFIKRKDKILPDGWTHGNTTYVAVTLRRLSEPEQLEKDLKADSPWADVMIIDAQMLQDWVAQYPSVESWLHEQGVGRHHNIRRLSAVWEDWKLDTNPKMSSGLLLSGREKVAHELRPKLNSAGEVFNILSESPDEVIGFLHAVICIEEDVIQDHLLSRCIVISNKDDTIRLRSVQPQTVVLLGDATDKAISVSHYGHTVINAIGNTSSAFRMNYVLSRSSKEAFREQLVEMGLNERDADIQTRACGSSPSLWRVWNQMENASPADIPEWTKGDNPSYILPAVMIGAWSENKEGDIEIVSHLSGIDYPDFKERLEHIQRDNHPQLQNISDVWSAIAPAVGFAYLTPKVTTAIMERFTEIVHTVFSEVDPTLDLEPDERPYASIHNATMKHSSWLRDGLAETILRISVLGNKLQEFGVIPGNRSSQEYVNDLVNGLEGLKTDARVMTSLSHQLPVLVEAAPIPFLEALEELIQGQSEDLARIFEEGESGFGHSFHHHFLWALERLAWNPAYLMRVSMSLMSLAKIDPGGRTINRPINSLKEIFLPWIPDTSASLEQRQEVLSTIIKGEYEFGWILLLELLPTLQGTSSPTNKPQWRDFGQTDRNRPTRKDVFLMYDWLIALAIAQVGDDADRLLDLLKHYSMFSLERQAELNQKLIEFSKLGDETGPKIAIWKALRDLVYRHRSYKDTEWAMPDAVLTELESILELFAPTSPLDKVKWLFNDQYPSIPISSDDFDSIDVELKRLRTEAVQDVLHEGGVDGVINLVDNVQYVYLLANPLVDQIDEIQECMELITKSISNDNNRRNFVSSLSEASFTKFGKEWNETLIKTASDEGWSPDLLAQTVLYYPDTIETYDLIDSLGKEVVSEYWRRKQSYIRSDEDEILVRGITRLNEAGRYLDIIGLTPKKLKVLSTTQVIELLDNAVLELNAGGEFRRGGDIGYYIELLIDWLREKEDCLLEDLARLEYRYLTLLTRGLKKPSLAIHKVISEDPEFFIKVICDLYKPKTASEEDEEIDEELAAKASQAWKLLQSWGTPPGLDEQGKVDNKKLESWVNQSLELAAEKDRLDITKEHIGKVLFHLPVDSETASWPCIELSELLESLKDSVIESGILYAQVDSRGGTSKAMLEGGKQERDIAMEWRNKLEVIDKKWIRIRALIQRIAEYWDRDAKREDERAEKDRLRFN
jgi:hypothetical protein